MTGIDFHVCDCPWGEHKPGCWLGEAEAVAVEAADSAAVYDPPRHRTVAVITALAEAGHLRQVPGEDATVGLLDALVELELLGPADDADSVSPDESSVDRREVDCG